MAACVWNKMFLVNVDAYGYGFKYGHGHGHGHQRNSKPRHLSMTKLSDLISVVSNHQSRDNANNNRNLDQLSHLTYVAIALDLRQKAEKQ